jgi:hypothetical protein
MHLGIKEHWRWPASHHVLGERQGTDPLTALRRNQPCWLILDFQPPAPGNTVSMFSPCSIWNFVPIVANWDLAGQSRILIKAAVVPLHLRPFLPLLFPLLLSLYIRVLPNLPISAQTPANKTTVPKPLLYMFGPRNPLSPNERRTLPPLGRCLGLTQMGCPGVTHSSWAAGLSGPLTPALWWKGETKPWEVRRGISGSGFWLSLLMPGKLS